MGEISRGIRVPEISEVLYLNRRLIEETGGHYAWPFNLLNEGSLFWVLERISKGKVFDIDPYPTLADKAALLAWTIINDHVFTDGCKRTGLVSAMVFLAINGKPISLSDREILEIAKRVAVYYEEPVYTLEDLSKWFQRKIDDG